MFGKSKKKDPIIVTHYSCLFETVNGTTHKFSSMKYIDEAAIAAEAPNYFLTQEVIKERFIPDDEGAMYPIYNIVKMIWVRDNTAEVENEGSELHWRIWYDVKENAV